MSVWHKILDFFLHTSVCKPKFSYLINPHYCMGVKAGHTFILDSVLCDVFSDTSRIERLTLFVELNACYFSRARMTYNFCLFIIANLYANQEATSGGTAHVGHCEVSTPVLWSKLKFLNFSPCLQIYHYNKFKQDHNISFF